VESRWESDQRVLAAVVELYEQAGDMVDAPELLAALGEDVDRDQVTQSIRRLASHGFIRALPTMTVDIPTINGVTEKGLRASGFWPSKDEAFERMLAALEEAADRDPDPERKSKIRTVLQSLRGVGRDVAVDVISTAINSGMGL
jgi:endonuclease III